MPTPIAIASELRGYILAFEDMGLDEIDLKNGEVALLNEQASSRVLDDADTDVCVVGEKVEVEAEAHVRPIAPDVNHLEGVRTGGIG